MKKILTFILSFLLLLCLVGCSVQPPVDEPIAPSNPTPSEPIDQPDVPSENVVVVITLSNETTITCELYPDVAPITVANFLKLADEGFYEGTIFHRVIYNFMIQGGGFYIEGRTVYQKEAPTIKGEFSANGVQNDLKHTAGVLSMARAQNMDSASSQFFICTADSSHLDGQYAAFGKVVDEESLQNAIALSMVPTTTVGYTMRDFPIEPVSILSIKRK